MKKERTVDHFYEEENVLAGAVGAFLFSLAGGVLWFVLYQVGYLAAISGIVGVICAIKGYALFAKKESVKGIVISVIMAVIVLAVAWYLCLSMDVYNAYQEWFKAGEVDFTVTFGEAVRGAYLFFEDSEIAVSYIKDLLFGLALCAFGAVHSIVNAVKRVKAEKEQIGAVVDDIPEEASQELPINE